MIKKIIIYLLFFLAGIYIARELIYIGARKNTKGIYDKFNTIFLKQNAYDVLFMGSSRAEMHFDPRIFDSLTGHYSYNIGVTGATPRIAFSVLKAYCSKSKAPKFLVFDVDIHFLKYGVDTIRNFPRYFPYLSNKVLLEQFSSIDPRFCSFKYNPLHSLPYSGTKMLSASLHGWLNKPGKYDTVYYQGHSAYVFEEFPKAHRSFYAFIHPRERAYIDSIIRFSDKNNIKLILLTSPMYKDGLEEMVNKKAIVTQLQNIASIHKLEYWDMSKAAYSGRPDYFADNYHMKHQGARLFTLGFAFNFKQYFDKKPVY